MDEATNKDQVRKKSRGRHGDGSAYLIGRRWYISLSVGGKQMTRSTGLGLKDKRKALEKLKDWRESARRGDPEPIIVADTKVNDCLDLVVRDYEQKKLHTLVDLNVRLRLHLRPALGDRQACSFSNDDAVAYINQREREGAAPATVQNEISALKRGFALAAEKGLLARKPHVKQIKVSNARTGFLTPAQFREFVALLPEHVAAVATVAYKTGCRRGELLGLTWDKVDLEARMIRLPAEDCKNGEARSIPLGSECMQILTARKAIRDERQPNFPYIFFYEHGGRLRVVEEFRAAWDRAVEAFGKPDLKLHDFRRSFCRNATRAGCHRKVVMEAGGWRTDSTFNRYNITDESDLRGLADRLETYEQSFGQTAKVVEISGRRPQEQEEQRQAAGGK